MQWSLLCAICFAIPKKKQPGSASKLMNAESKAISPLDKEAWLRVAGEWIKLAIKWAVPIEMI